MQWPHKWGPKSHNKWGGGPTQEALIRAKPNLIHPRDANALNAIDYGALRHTALRSMWSTASEVAWHEVEVHAVHLVLRLAAVSWDPRWDPGKKKVSGDPSKLHHTFHFLNCPPTPSFCRLAKMPDQGRAHHRWISSTHRRLLCNLEAMSCRTTSIPFKLMSCNISLLIFPIPSSRVVLDEKYVSLTFES